MFVKIISEGYIILIVYVDDVIIISSSDIVGIQATKDWLQSKVNIKDLEHL